MPATDSLNDSVFLKACRREKTPYTPVWLMRQAGRYMKDYRAIRDKTPFLDICKNKDLVTEITVTAQEKLNTDAAILFADILLLVEELGLGLKYLKGDGPSISKPVRTPEDVKKIPELDATPGLSYVFDAVRSTRKALKKNIPLIGFAGAPFTLVSYMIEGGGTKDFEKTKKLMYADERVWNALMSKVTRATAAYLEGQVDAGVQAVQIFDSWAGALEPREYEEYVLPHTKSLIASLGKTVPVIHFGTGTGRFLETFAKAGGDVVGVDHRVALGEAWRRVGYDRAIQGNLDPLVLCSSSSNMKSHAKTVLDAAAGRPGHIFNLGHGVLPDTPETLAIELVAYVHEASKN
jgi:uroporphyrinogen decarboxylase